MRAKSVAGVLLVAFVAFALVSCDHSPDGYTVKELKALPVSSLVVPDGEVIRTADHPGTTYKGPISTHITYDVRSDMSAEEVFAFYRAELTELGWTFEKITVQQGALLEASGRKGDFGVSLRIVDRAAVRDDSDWGSRRTVYRFAVVAAGRKGD